MKKIIITFIILISTLLLLPIDTSAAFYGSMAGIVDTSGTNLNVRSGPSTSNAVIDKIKDRSYLTMISTHGNFYYVEYQENKFGYVHKSYIDALSGDARKVSTGGTNLNVRLGPSTNYQIIDKVVNGDYVVVLKNHGSFSKVLYEGNKIGYVANTYINKSTTYKQIQLSIPSYKQYDSRWASVTIGSYGATMKEIGCLTTSIAMTESYRTGTTKTPLTIRNQSSYTSDGNMYWPSTYTTSTPSNYLQTIYNLLNQGKPVVVGFKNKYGGQHWVVVTGHNGSNTLQASNFTINDPGSSTRTKLSELISTYPNFYKLAYYK